MKAIELYKYGNSDRAFRISEIEKPVPKIDEVLIKVYTSGLNFADVIARRGLYPDAPKNPAVLGYDVVGEVVDVGSEVDRELIGQMVVGLTRFGGYAEYAVAMKQGVTVLPPGYDIHVATALATQACTAYYCAEDCVTLHRGDKVLVHAAAGGVGSILVQLARYRDCEVFATASSGKLDYIRSLGADHVIDYTSQKFDKEIKTISSEGVDVVFDSIGGRTFGKGMKLLQPGGKMVSFGAASQINGSRTNKIKAAGVVFGFGIFSPIQLLMESRSMITVNMLRIADHRPDIFEQTLSGVVQLAADGVIKPRLAATFPYHEVAQAHKLLESRKSIGKVTLDWT